MALFLTVAPVEDDPDLLQRHHPLRNHLFDDGEKQLYLLHGVSDLDNDGQVGREAENVGRMNRAVHTEALKTSKCSSSG